MQFYQKQSKEKLESQKQSEIQKDLPKKSDAKQTQDKTFANINKNKNNDLRQSVLLKNKEEQDQQGWCTKLCACTQLSYYKDYFKVTNNDVKRRMLSSLKFWEGGFFTPAQQQYDFYGPFWIYTTIVFCLGAVHNILKYQGNPNFQYNYEILGEAFFIIYLLGFGIPAGIGFLMKFLGISNTIIQIICLYGYSMTIYIICIILCSINFCILHWIFLIYASINKVYFIFKNLNDGYQIPTNRKLLLTVIIIIEGALQFFVIKIRFIQCTESITKSSTISHMASTHQNFVHSRTFSLQN